MGASVQAAQKPVLNSDRADAGYASQSDLAAGGLVSASGLPQNERVRSLLQLRHALNDSPQARAQAALQRHLNRGFAQAAPVQRRPLKDAASGEWKDKNFPSLTLAQPAGYQENQFLLGDGTVVWWLDGEYYLDANYVKLYKPPERSVAGQRHFIALPVAGTVILNLASVTASFDKQSSELMQVPDPDKVATQLAEIKAGKAIYPIQLILLPKGIYRLLQGRHRIIASQLVHFTEIPALVYDSTQQAAPQSPQSAAGSAAGAPNAGAAPSDTGGAAAAASSYGAVSAAGISGAAAAAASSMAVPKYHTFGDGMQIHSEAWIADAYAAYKSNLTKLQALASMMMTESPSVDPKMKTIYRTYLVQIYGVLHKDKAFGPEAQQLQKFLAAG